MSYKKVQLADNVIMYCGDCAEVLQDISDFDVDSCVTDPPYGLSSSRVGAMCACSEEGDPDPRCKICGGTGKVLPKGKGGFMGCEWDIDIPEVKIWRYVNDLLKPGAYVLAFAGTRTQHRMACNIEDGGFEIRDIIAWMYSSGAPKGLDVSRAIDNHMGSQRKVVDVEDERVVSETGTEEAQTWDGWHTALKPSMEPITVARKVITGTVAECVLEHGTGAMNVQGCRIEDESKVNVSSFLEGDVGEEEKSGRWPTNILHDGSPDAVDQFPGKGKKSTARFFKEFKQDGWEEVFVSSCLLMDVLDIGGTVCKVRNVNTVEKSLLLQEKDVGSVLNDVVILASLGDKQLSGLKELFTNVTVNELRRIGETLTTIVKSSEKKYLLDALQGKSVPNGSIVRCVEIQEQTGTMMITIDLKRSGGCVGRVILNIMQSNLVHGEKGFVRSRFKYCAKASSRDRDEGLYGFTKKECGVLNKGAKKRNTHFTVKPTDLMRYLCRLVTRPGGIVIDPYMGSGSTGKAAVLEGMGFIGIEREEESFEIAVARVRHALMTMGRETIELTPDMVKIVEEENE